MANSNNWQELIAHMEKELARAYGAGGYWPTQKGVDDMPDFPHKEAPPVPDDTTGAAADDRVTFNIVFRDRSTHGPKSVLAHYYQYDETENTYDFFETKGDDEGIVFTVAKDAVLYIEVNRG